MLTKKDDDTLTAIDLEECKEISDRLKILSKKLRGIYREFTDFIDQECPKYFSEGDYKRFKEVVEYHSYQLCEIGDTIEEYADYIYRCSKRKDAMCDCTACMEMFMNRLHKIDDLF
ncbi:MAG: hypothetical protein NC177_02555 [Ruminococcus flavefaciens]|nr:hypothetical protein [Ruminococcus flavefaciens]